MVHETTEYRRKYRWNSPQKRHQIWKENWNFRKARKLLEFQHEPFDSWNEEQSSESSVTDEIANEFLPPSKLKQKYLEVIKETTNHSKIHMIDRATSPEYCPSLSESLLSEKNKCDVGVQTPNWDDLKYESDKDSDREMYIENDLLEIARRLKEGVMCNVNTLDFINQVINRARSSSPPRKKDTRDSYSHLLRDKHQTHQSKSPISLCSQINKQKDNADKKTYNVKISKNIHSSTLKTQRQKLVDTSKLSQQKLPETKEMPYKREGHRVINDLKNYVESATKWLCEYDNRYQYGPRHTRI